MSSDTLRLCELGEDPLAAYGLSVHPDLVARRLSAREALYRLLKAPKALSRSRVLDVLDAEYHRVARVHRLPEGLLYVASLLVEAVENFEDFWYIDDLWCGQGDKRARERLQPGEVVVRRCVVEVVDWLAHPTALLMPCGGGDGESLPAYCEKCRRDPDLRLPWVLRQCEVTTAASVP